MPSDWKKEWQRCLGMCSQEDIRHHAYIRDLIQCKDPSDIECTGLRLQGTYTASKGLFIFTNTFEKRIATVFLVTGFQMITKGRQKMEQSLKK